ncbi:MAG: N-formylglutamate amidohydrolase [Alphaproteobacteria bacterium]|nr:N-formylglutamate amidohydrolase [Alphaproteobacteria bacterium]
MTERARRKPPATRLYAAAANAPATCLVADSPHSGRKYPDDFNYAVTLGELRQAEDAHVDRLFSFLPAMGVPLLTARAPRSYVDANRADSVSAAWARAEAKGENPDYTPQEGGLIRSPATPRHTAPVYSRPLKLSEAFNRVSTYHKPYHARLAALIDKTAKAHGGVVHLNLHSMPSTTHRGTRKSKYDIILGTRDGETADDHYLQKLRKLLEAKGYKVGLNVPGFRGAEIVRRHGNPAAGRHSIQVEINRALYMNEKTLRRLPRMKQLQTDLEDTLRSFRAYCDAACAYAQKSAPKKGSPRI